jgi:hypothetical protein
VRLDCQRKAVEHLLGSGHLPRGLALLKGICDDVGVPYPETRGRAMLSAVWQRVKIRAHGLKWQERDEKDVPKEMLRRLDVYTAIGLGFVQIGLVRGEDFHARGLYLALRAGERRRLARYFLWESMFLANGGDDRNSLFLYENGARIAAVLDDPFLKGLAEGTRGFLALSHDHHREAFDAFEESLRIWRERGTGTWEQHIAVPMFLQIGIDILGRVREERARFESLTREAEQRGDRLMQTILRTSCGLVWLARGDADGLEAALDSIPWRLAAIMEAGVSRYESWWEVFETITRAQIALFRGDRRGLEAVYPALHEAAGSLLGRLPMVRSRSRSLVGRVALALGQRDTARKAADELQGFGTRYAMLLAEALRAGCEAQEGNASASAARLLPAQRLSDSLGTRLLSLALLRRRGELLGQSEGRALVAEADERLRAEQFVDPERICRIVAPGFRPLSP